jgi:hypothetical protein
MSKNSRAFHMLHELYTRVLRHQRVKQNELNAGLAERRDCWAQMESLEPRLLLSAVLDLGDAPPTAESTASVIVDVDLGGAITDANGGPMTTDFTFTILESAMIEDLNVRLAIAHTYVEDLTITLSSPGDVTTVSLFDEFYSGGGVNFQDTVLDDNPTLSFIGDFPTSSPPYAGAYRPGYGEAWADLSDFNGLDMQGTWTLSITDNYGGDSGTVYQAGDAGAWSGIIGTQLILEVPVTSENESPTVAVDNPEVTVNEGETALNTGTFDDADLGDSVTITASVGTITQDTGNSGNWSWSFATSDDPDSQTVTITADDGNDGVATATFDLTVSNVAPTVEILTLPPTLYQYEAMDLSATFADAGGLDTHTASIDWGDGTVTPDAITGSHHYTASGTFTVTVTVTDDDGGTNSATLTVTVLDTTSAIDDLLGRIETMDLANGVENSLESKLAAVAHLFEQEVENDAPFEAIMDAFLRGVDHWYEKGRLTLAQHGELTHYGELIQLDLLG